MLRHRPEAVHVPRHATSACFATAAIRPSAFPSSSNCPATRRRSGVRATSSSWSRSDRPISWSFFEPWNRSTRIFPRSMIRRRSRWTTLTDLIYLLDTNVVSDLVRNPLGKVFLRLSEVGARRACTSIVVACEMRAGVEKTKSARLSEVVVGVLRRLPVLPLEGDVDVVYGRLRADLERSGRPIGGNDLLIAAHALSLGLILVTHNTREFGRVAGLRVEDWLA